MQRSLFLRIVDAVTANDEYFQQRPDGAGRQGLSPLQKCTAAMRVLAYGASADAVDEYLRMGASTTREALMHFIDGVISCFGDEYLRKPNEADLARLLYVGDQRGFPGSLNDINVLHRSPIFDDVLTGQSPKVSYVVNGHEYDKTYYLTDGIYPSWAAFVKSITSPQIQKHKLFAQVQEACRKDVERAFGVLQARFAFIRRPCLVWDIHLMGKIMIVCIIMHNMIVEDERDTYQNYHDPAEFINDMPTEDDGQSTAYSTEQIANLSRYMANREQLRLMDRFVEDVENCENASPSPTHPKEHHNQVCMDIGRLFYEYEIPFNVATSPPTMYELRTRILKEEVKTTDEINAQKLFELLDQVIEEIGEKIVVQVVTDNASAYKAAGNMLMEKRKKLYWTPCAAHCFDLMLEKIGELPQQKNALIKAKRDCKRCFISNEWSNCAWENKPEGKAIKKIVMDDRNFWRSVVYSIKTTKPLVHVLQIVDGETPAMGFIYGAMDEAKERIAKNLDDDVSSYKEIWDIIDAKWDHQLHRDLHASGYFLNPRFRWFNDFSNHSDITRGLFACVERLVKDDVMYSKIEEQINEYENRQGLFFVKRIFDKLQDTFIG
ncbi:hypothetical protein OSB04_012637 [Centaurea solstitialis]|uniref:DUF659 domain-containing protein n=1 Tax=Centaurea solstitialis TaxID=347529 RepID=A0AA38TWH2_9ASTR|nr:hypothetical protein OSB04_012637 [Centaurea solstitialis]